MGFRTMVSPNGGQAPHFQPLVRQGSLYNLTLDEVHNQLGDLGKPLSSMNLDELLKSVIAAEENQVLENQQMAGASSSSFPIGFQRQGSFNLGRTLSRKTVDEVWREIQQEQNNADMERIQRQATLGEMTLEDFLVRAGVVNLNQALSTMETAQSVCNPMPLVGLDPMVAASSAIHQQQADWLQYQLNAANSLQRQQLQQQQQTNLMPVLGANLPVAPAFGVGRNNPILDVAYAENPLPLSSSIMGTSQDSQIVDRKRHLPDEIMEKTVERRQKRMIKNRESAARSRARKQAYTNQLENEVSTLKERNERLKKQQAVEMLLPSELPTEPTYQLRRISSAPF